MQWTGSASLGALWRCVAFAAATFLLAYSTSPGTAQTSNHKPHPRSAEKRPTASAASNGTNYWVARSDLGRYNAPASRVVDRVPEQTSEFGRVALRDSPGTVGFSSGSGLSPSQLHDGSSVPGMERYNTTSTGGYAGLSVSVPNLDKTLPLLVPVPTPWNRAE